MQKFWQAFLKCDRVLFVTIFLLFAFGLTALYSVQLGLGPLESSLVVKQVLFFCAGLALASFMTVDYRLWQPFYPWLYVLCLFTPPPIHSFWRGHPRRPLLAGFWFFIWQPVEIIKVLLILCVAGYFSKQGRHLRTWKPLIVSGVSVAVLVAVTMIQPDLGRP